MEANPEYSVCFHDFDEYYTREGKSRNIDLSKGENIEVTDADIDAEIKKIAEQYKMEEEKVINDIEQNINKKVRQSIDENQREYILREKLKRINE